MEPVTSARWTTGLLVAALSLSGVALLLHASVGWHLASSVVVFIPLTAFLAIAAWVGARPELRARFLQRLWAGAFAGFIGLIAYDGIRGVILLSGTVPFNPFRAIETFGLLILQTDVTTPGTKALGWFFHLWNGLTFAAMFTVAFGRGSLLGAVGWALVLELAMIATYPSLFRIQLDAAFLFVSIVGHLAYGLALGWTAARVVED